jgi:hypothetical protein
MTDYKQMCAELLAALEEEASNWNLDPECHPLVVRARAALAEPEPKGPPQPVPVSERLPGDELCWWYELDEDDGYGGMWTLLRIRGGTTCYTHWLPAHALPQPS